MAKRKDAPVPLSKLKFSGDTAIIVHRLQAAMKERDDYIVRLENENAGLEKCASKVWTALEEAEAMANRFPQYVQDAINDQKRYQVRLIEMSRYARLFHDAKGDFQRLRP